MGDSQNRNRHQKRQSYEYSKYDFGLPKNELNTTYTHSYGELRSNKLFCILATHKDVKRGDKEGA